MTFLISNVLHSQRGNPSSCMWTQYSTPWSAPAHPSMPFSPHGFFWCASSGLNWADLLNLTSKKASSRKSWINPFRISPWALPSQLSYIAIGLHYSAFSTLLGKWKRDGKVILSRWDWNIERSPNHCHCQNLQSSWTVLPLQWFLTFRDQGASLSLW